MKNFHIQQANKMYVHDIIVLLCKNNVLIDIYIKVVVIVVGLCNGVRYSAISHQNGAPFDGNKTQK